MIPYRDKKTDIASDVLAGKRLHTRIKKLANEVADKNVKSQMEMDTAVAEIAKRERFNRAQIQRLIEEANTVTYNKRYDKLKHLKDRRISFTVASLDGVVNEMGSDAPEEMVNPNLATGGKGEGEMKKSASTEIESSHIHSPHAKLDERRERYMDKVASVRKKSDEKERVRAEKEMNSGIFKAANCLVMSQKLYKNANEIFNTLLSEADLSDDVIETISKKATDLSDELVRRGRARKDFMVPLKQDETEKVASRVLGEHSLLKEAEHTRVTDVKVNPTTGISSFEDLVKVAHKIENDRAVATSSQES